MLISTTAFEEARSRALIPIQCPICKETFHLAKHHMQINLKRKINPTCSRSCRNRMIAPRRHKVPCTQCGDVMEKTDREIEGHKKKGLVNHFCSSSCFGTYNNSNRTHGYRRSKLEAWMEEALKRRYPGLEVECNGKRAIGSELDFYIPSLKLAFELNGVFHYEPVYGDDTFEGIQRRDRNKFARCQELGISLCVIDVSKHRYFKEAYNLPYLKIVTDIIDSEIVRRSTTSSSRYSA